MKAAVLTHLNKPLDILSGIECSEPGPGQVLVKLSYSGVCHSQLMEVRGRRGADHYLPHLLGHEGSGKVVAVGKDVKKVKDGDLVILGWIKGNGLDTGGLTYSCNHLPHDINAGSVTTFNEYALVSENRVLPLPTECSTRHRSAVRVRSANWAGIITNDLRPIAGSCVAVFGLGGIGMSAFDGDYACSNVPK